MMDSPEAAVNLAKMVAKQPGPPIELNVMADLFLQRNMVREATAFLLDVLSDNNPEHERLQTKVNFQIHTVSNQSRQDLDNNANLLTSAPRLRHASLTSAYVHLNPVISSALSFILMCKCGKPAKISSHFSSQHSLWHRHGRKHTSPSSPSKLQSHQTFITLNARKLPKMSSLSIPGLGDLPHHHLHLGNWPAFKPKQLFHLLDIKVTSCYPIFCRVRAIYLYFLTVLTYVKTRTLNNFPTPIALPLRTRDFWDWIWSVVVGDQPGDKPSSGRCHHGQWDPHTLR